MLYTLYNNIFTQCFLKSISIVSYYIELLKRSIEYRIEFNFEVSPTPNTNRTHRFQRRSETFHKRYLKLFILSHSLSGISRDPQ